MTDTPPPDDDDQDFGDVAVRSYDADPDGDEYELTRPIDLAGLQHDLVRAFRTTKPEDIGLTTVADPTLSSVNQPVKLWVTGDLDRTEVQRVIDTHQYDPTTGGTP